MLKRSRTQLSFFIGGILLLLISLATFFGMSIRQERLIIGLLHSSADSMFRNIVLARRWNANYGGVYVLKRPGIESNQFLKNPDIKTIDGKIYTKKPPALMTKEISQYANEAEDFSYHITSLTLTNPKNAPDEWEKNALLEFEKGITEVTQISNIDGKNVYRLMRPLKYERSCDTCHSEQGYELVKQEEVLVFQYHLMKRRSCLAKIGK